MTVSLAERKVTYNVLHTGKISRLYWATGPRADGLWDVKAHWSDEDSMWEAVGLGRTHEEAFVNLLASMDTKMVLDEPPVSFWAGLADNGHPVVGDVMQISAPTRIEVTE